jgi:hypothetical protein
MTGLSPGQVVLTSATENVVLAVGTNVATFSDDDLNDTAADFTATVDWGDGSPLDTGKGIGTVTVTGSNGSFTVTGAHTYTDEGSDSVIATITRNANQQTVSMTGTVSVGEFDQLSVAPVGVVGNPGQLLSNVPVANFSTTYLGNNLPNDFTATIDWGDGTTSAGTVAAGNGSLQVLGSHTYLTGGPYILGGQYTFTVNVADDAPGTATATARFGTALINFAGQMALHSVAEGTTQPIPVANFIDYLGETADKFTASIDWGDGVTTPGIVTASGAMLTVSGGHAYADEGSDQVSVTLTRTSDQVHTTVSGSVAVAEADSLTGHPVSFTTHAHQAFTGTVATFDDTYAANVPGDLVATIDWGDGTTTAGTVSGGSGTFTVSGAHTYANPGQDTVTVRLADDAPGTANAMATSTATVGFAIVPKNDFTGDGKSDVILQNTNGTPQIWLMNGTSVTSMTSLVNSGPSWQLAATGDFNRDGKADIVLQNSDGLPEIWLMNGTSVTSTVTLPNPGPSWHVIAAGDFVGNGNADILWQNTDGAPAIWLMNGTSIVGGGVLPINPGPSWHVIGAADVNGDGTADILWQNNDGTPAIWEMNGTSIVGGGLLLNPGPSWHAIGLGDFNGDGNADILWQNADGAPAIWELNGTSIIGGGVLLNPGPSWHAIGTSDFNGDGKADIVWQSTDGTPAIWEMNGTSIIGGGVLPNPGAAWQVKDDGPIPADQMGTASAGSGASAPGGALHLSAPDLLAGGAVGPQGAGGFLPLIGQPVFRT